jgi:queuine tRNA-ribosyltransferase
MSAGFTFALLARDGAARRGRMATAHGTVETPAFMPVGTAATVKAMRPEDVAATGAEIVLANTYHLMLRPGAERIAALGGLHRFMNWPRPILTDSGGFQVMSLAKLRAIDESGVTFRSHLDGTLYHLTPERSIEIQRLLGSDIAMAFDECTPFPADEKLAAAGVRRTLAWMERCAAAHRRADQALFGIVQGSVYEALRERCASELVAMDLPGYAIGGVSVGEGHELLCRVTGFTAPMLPAAKPRYLMGVGMPEDLLAAIGFGMDLFDCVIPTRFARSAAVFTARGRIRLTNRRYRRDAYPIDVSCDCSACAGGFSRAYLHHLFAANEILSAILCSIHNVRFYERLVQNAREAIRAGRYEDWQRAFLAGYVRETAGD